MAGTPEGSGCRKGLLQERTQGRHAGAWERRKEPGLFPGKRENGVSGVTQTEQLWLSQHTFCQKITWRVTLGRLSRLVWEQLLSVWGVTVACLFLALAQGFFPAQRCCFGWLTGSWRKGLVIHS